MNAPFEERDERARIVKSFRSTVHKNDANARHYESLAASRQTQSPAPDRAAAAKALMMAAKCWGHSADACLFLAGFDARPRHYFGVAADRMRRSADAALSAAELLSAAANAAQRGRRFELIDGGQQ